MTLVLCHCARQLASIAMDSIINHDAVRRPGPVLAVCIRNRVAGIVLVVSGQIHKVWRRHFAFAKGRSRVDYLAERLERIRQEHGVTTVVVEPGSIAELAAQAVGLIVERLHIAEAKAVLFAADLNLATHRDLASRLVGSHPLLARYVTVLGSGNVAVAPHRRWQTVTVLAAALGLAHHHPSTAS